VQSARHQKEKVCSETGRGRCVRGGGAGQGGRVVVWCVGRVVLSLMELAMPTSSAMPSCPNACLPSVLSSVYRCMGRLQAGGRLARAGGYEEGMKCVEVCAECVVVGCAVLSQRCEECLQEVLREGERQAGRHRRGCIQKEEACSVAEMFAAVPETVHSQPQPV